MHFQIGMTGVHTTAVEQEHTAHAVGNPGVEVLSTPMLTLFCEIAGHNAIVDVYDKGYTSVGFHNDLYHLAATPVGSIVTVTATLLTIENRRLTFTIDGHDDEQQIVKGVHERSVVRLDKFLADVRGSRNAR